MNIRWTTEASNELEAVRLQVLHASYSSRTANRFFHHLLDEADRLIIFPQGGKREPLLAHRTDADYRSLVVHPHYKLIYFIDEPQQAVVIVDLWDTRREPQQLTEGLK